MDAVVVGGGVIGAACAMALARDGAAVTLIERSELAAGASGRNHGLVLSPTDPGLVPMPEVLLGWWVIAIGVALMLWSLRTRSRR